MDNDLEFENFMSGYPRKVFLVYYVDWNDETTIIGIFSSYDKAESYLQSTDCDFLRHIDVYELDSVTDYHE